MERLDLTAPGATSMTSILNGRHSIASVSLSRWKAAFVAQYSPFQGVGLQTVNKLIGNGAPTYNSPETEPIFTMSPLLRSAIDGITALATRRREKVLVSKVRCICSAGRSMRGPAVDTMRINAGPNWTSAHRFLERRHYSRPHRFALRAL